MCLPAWAPQAVIEYVERADSDGVGRRCDEAVRSEPHHPPGPGCSNATAGATGLLLRSLRSVRMRYPRIMVWNVVDDISSLLVAQTQRMLEEALTRFCCALCSMVKQLRQQMQAGKSKILLNRPPLQQILANAAATGFTVTPHARKFGLDCSSSGKRRSTVQKARLRKGSTRQTRLVQVSPSGRCGANLQRSAIQAVQTWGAHVQGLSHRAARAV